MIEAMARAEYEDDYGGSMEPLNWDKADELTRSMWREGIVAAIRAAEAAGYKLVPVEPTQEMLDAATQEMLDASWDEPIGQVEWKAMIEAAPKLTEGGK